MSQPDYNMTEYDKYVPYLLGMVYDMIPDPNAVNQFPGAKLFLHLIEKNFRKNGSIQFDGTVLKEADAHYYIKPDGNNFPENTKSDEFAAFIAAILSKMNSRTLEFNIKKDEYDTFPPYMKELLDTLYTYTRQPSSYATLMATNVRVPPNQQSSYGSALTSPFGDVSPNQQPPPPNGLAPAFKFGKGSALTSPFGDVSPNQQPPPPNGLAPAFPFGNVSPQRPVANVAGTPPPRPVANVAQQPNQSVPPYTGLDGLDGGASQPDIKTFLPLNGLINSNTPTYFAVKLGIGQIYSDSKWRPTNDLLTLTSVMPGGVNADNSILESYIDAGMKGTGKNLPYELNKFFLRSMIDEEVKLQQQSKGSTAFFETPPEYENIFYRKVGQPGKLFRKDAEGKEESVGERSEKFMELTKQGNCFTTGFVDVENVTCEQFVSKCLIGQNIKECFQFMKDHHFSTKSMQDVKDMNPSMALRLLKKFGFAIKNVKSDELGVMLDRVDTASEWIESLKKYHMNDSNSKKLTSEEINTIAQNRKLTSYLDLVSNMINANPSILNTGYNGPSPTINKEQFKGTTFSKYGMKPKYSVSNGSNVASVSSLKSLQTTVVNNRNIVSALYGVPIVGFMAGGSHEQQSKDSYQNLEIAEIFENHFKQFILSLEENDKTLDPTDKDKVQTLIDELKVLESKLNKARIYSDKYMKLVNVFGHIQNNNVIKFDHIQKFVDNKNNYFQKVNKKQDSLFDILSALANATQQETKVESKPVTAYPDWVRKN